MSQNVSIRPNTQWVIWYCLEITYLILDLSGDSVPSSQHESTFKAENHPVRSQNGLISNLSSKKSENRDLNEELEISL